jgi:hypothetical protein
MGAGGSAGSKVRFTGSATGCGATDSHGRKMAPGRGFYEAGVHVIPDCRISGKSGIHIR